MSVGGISVITNRALSAARQGTTPADASASGYGTTGGALAGSDPAVAPADASSTVATAATPVATDPAYAAAAADGANVPAQWNDAVRGEFLKLGLTANQVANIEALGLAQADVEVAYQNLAKDPSIAQQIPDTPPSGTTGTAGTAQTQGGGQPAPTGPTGPPAWSDEWRQKFVDAGAPAELIQQLTYTGAMGADAAQLESSLAQLKQTVDTELATFRSKFPKAYEQLAGSKLDRATLYQIAAAANAGQISQEQFSQIVEQAGMTPGKMIKDMFLKQFLPWTIIPGWGAIRVVGSLFTGGKDPISGDKIHLDFWNHGFTGWMDALMAVGGAMTLASGIRGAMTVTKGLNFAKGATGELGALAAREGLQNLSGMGKLKAYLPWTQTSKSVAGFAQLDGLAGAISKLEVGSVSRVAAESLYSKILSGSVRLESNMGVKASISGIWNDGRTAVFHRNKPMFAWAQANGQSILRSDARNAGAGFQALFAGAGTEALSASQRAEQMLRYADKLGANPTLEGLKRIAVAEAGAAYGITQPTSIIGKMMGAAWPGPIQDVLKAMNNSQPSAVSMALKNPLVKFGGLAALGVGAAVFGKDILGSMMGAGGEAGGEQAAQGAGQITVEQQQMVQQFLALPADQQQAYMQQATTQVQLLTQLASGGAAPADLSAEDQAAVQQFLAAPADQQQAFITQMQGEIDMLTTALQTGAVPEVTPAGGDPAAPAEPAKPLTDVDGQTHVGTPAGGITHF